MPAAGFSVTARREVREGRASRGSPPCRGRRLGGTRSRPLCSLQPHGVPSSPVDAVVDAVALVALIGGGVTAAAAAPRVSLVLYGLFVFVYVTDRCARWLLVTRASDRTFRRAIELWHGPQAPAPKSKAR